VNIYINNKLVCESKAVYGKKGATVTTSLPSVLPKKVLITGQAISEMTVCPNTITVKKGDVLTFAAKYDTSKHAV
jgi:hypothetical protein